MIWTAYLIAIHLLASLGVFYLFVICWTCGLCMFPSD